MTLSDKELGYLSHILWHFTDYMTYDDRPDHGLGILKQYRELDEERKREIYRLAGRLNRIYKRRANKQKNSV